MIVINNEKKALQHSKHLLLTYLAPLQRILFSYLEHHQGGNRDVQLIWLEDLQLFSWNPLTVKIKLNLAT